MRRASLELEVHMETAPRGPDVSGASQRKDPQLVPALKQQSALELASVVQNQTSFLPERAGEQGVAQEVRHLGKPEAIQSPERELECTHYTRRELVGQLELVDAESPTFPVL